MAVLLGASSLSLITKGSWMHLGRVAKLLVIPLTPVTPYKKKKTSIIAQNHVNDYFNAKHILVRISVIHVLIIMPPTHMAEALSDAFV